MRAQENQIPVSTTMYQLTAAACRIRSAARLTVAMAGLVAVVASGDTMYVSFWNNSVIWKSTLDGVGSVFADTGLIEQTGLAADAARNLYVAHWVGPSPPGAGLIQKFTPQGLGSDFASTAMTHPGGLAFDRAGNLYVASSSYITKFTPAGVPSTFTSTGVSAGQGLAFDQAGNLYVANWSGSTIRKYSPTGANLGVFASTGLSGPVGLAFDGAGNLYAANRENNTIWKYTPGGVGSLFASTGLISPRGLAFDSAGNLYAANMTGYTIEKFSPTGIDLGAFADFSATYAAPDFIVILPDVIPEPSTVAILGLGAMLVIGRQKLPHPRSAE
jgi:sugar lactone lactonase YvrE